MLMMPLALGLLWLELKVLSSLFIDRPAPPPVRVAREPMARRKPRQRSAPAEAVEQAAPVEVAAES